MLETSAITLLDPSGWDDKNDAYFLETYRNNEGANRVFALCFTEAQQKYHHWSVFASGADGVCISFHKNKLLDAIKLQPNIEIKKVRYLASWKAQEYIPFTSEGLKFTKNIRYSDEKEWRMFHTDFDNVQQNPSLPISSDMIHRVTISPWLPKPLVGTLRNLIRSLPDGEKLDLRRSTLVDHAKWRSIADASILRNRK